MPENNVQTMPAAANAKKIISLGLILFTVTAITGVILGMVHEITLEPIRQTQARLKNEALAGALPEADAFAPIALAENVDPVIKDVIKDVQEARAGGNGAGYCVTVTPKGYAGVVEIVVGITDEGHLRGIRILSQSETPGLGAKSANPEFFGQYDNKDAPKLTVVKSAPSEPDQIQAISGATITSNGVTSGVNAALSYWRRHLAPGATGVDDIGAVSGASIPEEGA
ncbi:MAG: RnfABCDGE type electron transport complex subunit G [Synergistaceae bacterium]|jgi:electron transport complex protein RnfG|nr:RnfABCDGE type electron transport complex subunit G [Synergistaceae bacterium]